MKGKTLITNIKSKQNVKEVLQQIRPEKIVILSSKMIKFKDFDIEMENLIVKEDLEMITHELNGILNENNDILMVVKPDKAGMYLLWLAQIHLINPTYMMVNGEIEQIPMIDHSKLADEEGNIVKLADCHGFIDPKSINKEFGIKEEKAGKHLVKLSKMGILKFVERREFKVGDMKKHPYYDTDLLEKGKDMEDFYTITDLGRLILYLELTKS